MLSTASVETAHRALEKHGRAAVTQGVSNLVACVLVALTGLWLMSR